MTAYRAKPPKGALLNRAAWLSPRVDRAYLFNEGSGLKLYDLGNGAAVDATLTNGPTWPSSPYGKAVRFTLGSTQYASAGNYTSVAAGFTIAALFSPRALSGNQQIVAADDSGASSRIFQFRTSGSNLQGIAFDSGGSAYTITGGTTLVNNQWYFAVLTNNGVAANLYLGGKPDATAVNTGTMPSLTTTLGIAARFSASSWNEPASHDVAFVMTLRGALSAGQVRNWSSDPFRMFRPRRVYVASAAGNRRRRFLCGAA